MEVCGCLRSSFGEGGISVMMVGGCERVMHFFAVGNAILYVCTQP